MHSARIQAADKLLKESPEKQYRVAATQPNWMPYELWRGWGTAKRRRT